MAKRYVGNAVVNILYRDRGDYAGTISVGRKVSFRFADLHAAPAGFGRGIGYDSAVAYDEMAESAVGFASYYTSGNRGDDVPDWAPSERVAAAIAEATMWALNDQGEYEVRRSPPRRK